MHASVSTSNIITFGVINICNRFSTNLKFLFPEKEQYLEARNCYPIKISNKCEADASFQTNREIRFDGGHSRIINF
jgi:hypothetical protein